MEAKGHSGNPEYSTIIVLLKLMTHRSQPKKGLTKCHLLVNELGDTFGLIGANGFSIAKICVDRSESYCYSDVVVFERFRSFPSSERLPLVTRIGWRVSGLYPAASSTESLLLTAKRSNIERYRRMRLQWLQWCKGHVGGDLIESPKSS